MRHCLAAAFFFALLSAAPVQAADRDGDPEWAPAAEETLKPVHFGPAAPSRGSLLPSLYVTLAGLNAFDAYSTNTGLSRGAGEANPLMQNVAGTPAAMWAVKGATTATTIYLAERLWRKNQKAKAIAVMVVSNGLMAVVAARNASVLRSTLR